MYNYVFVLIILWKVQTKILQFEKKFNKFAR